MRLALVRLSALGDIVLAARMLQFLKAQRLNISISWVVDQRFAPILHNSPYIDTVISLDLKGLSTNLSWERVASAYRTLKESGNFDLVIDLHGMIKSAIVAKLLGPTVGFGVAEAAEPLASLLYKKRFLVGATTYTERFRHLAFLALGLDPGMGEPLHHQPFLFASPTAQRKTSSLWLDSHPKIVIVIGSSMQEKEYPTHLWIQVIKKCGLPVFLIHGNEREEQLAKTIASSTPLAYMIPRLSLDELKALMSQADLVVGVDSGPTHIAWGCGTPTITLMGHVIRSRRYRNDSYTPTDDHELLRPPPKAIPTISPAAIAPEIVAQTMMKMLRRKL
ncbi:MAG: lipopolysaccharide heptosyltransferase I [Campylobacterales bacterium]